MGDDRHTYEWEMTADEVVDQARQRGNQENLHAQLKSNVRSLHAPVNTRNASSTPSWPPSLAAFIATPAQIVKTGRSAGGSPLPRDRLF